MPAEFSVKRPCFNGFVFMTDIYLSVEKLNSLWDAFMRRPLLAHVGIACSSSLP
jgi:hypothetical protein